MVSDAAFAQPLPPGWASGEDSEGRTFYIDHTNQTSNSSMHRRPASPRLSSVWEARTASNGRVYYLNHRTHRTQWERPSADNLPDGWEERVDANGRTFFVDHVNHITQWERPTEPVSHTDDVEQLRRQATQMFLTTRHQISQEDVDHRTSNRASISATQSSASLISSGSDTEPLPPGWSMSRTEAGKVFFIDHSNRVTTWDDPRVINKVRESSSNLPAMAIKSADKLGPLPDGWEERTHSDGRTFFINHVLKTTQWEDPRLAKLGGPAVKYNRDYQQKYNYFRSTLRKPTDLPNKVDIKVKRNDLLETSFQAVMSKADPNMLKTRLWVEFDGEKGLDYGGVSREWFYLLSKEMFNPYYGLFENSAADNYTLQINPLSGTLQTDDHKYFQFIGRVAGMAAFHGRLLDCFFIRPFYKMMLGKEITLQDMQSVDLEYYNSLNWIIDNSVEGLDMTFSVDDEILGKMEEYPLKPNGANIPVTDRNKHEYVNLVIKHRFCDRIERQMKAFNKGFSEIIPQHMLKIFDENELEMLLSGIQDIDVKDWQEHTRYKGDYGPNHPTIVNFWKCIYLMSNEARARLLQFVTGTSRVPTNGFEEMYGSNGKQLFTIENWGSVDKYPRAHTCFNRLDLPPYSSYEDLTERLTTAVESCEGFAGVD
ncbi:E3 ubiquitin-protein ligase NEDD4-like [Watersipora subatra]|uniref:E3 ubiquitin-protein ligase NEDD4-like n=1 Tax=Watersipora subatra TaxID=2589382 RepID=UPI00355BD8D4